MSTTKIHRFRPSFRLIPVPACGSVPRAGAPPRWQGGAAAPCRFLRAASPCARGRTCPFSSHGGLAVQTYFIASATRVKIGKSRDPHKRLVSLQTASPEHLTLILILDEDREQELHRKFAAYRLRGEWFERAPLIHSFVDEYAAFYRWLRIQVKRDDPIGDLARDASNDKHFPRSASDYPTLQGHPRACRQARSALAHAFREWQLSKRATH